MPERNEHDEQELTPEEVSAMADEIMGRPKEGDGFFYDAVARAVAAAEAEED